MKNKILIFFHLPKTGGTTLNGILFKNFNRNQNWNFSFYEGKSEINNMMEAIKAGKISLISGHMAFGLHNYLKDYKYNYFTLLREPIARIQSYYHHFQRLPQERKVDFIGVEKKFATRDAADWSIADLLQMKISNQIDNGYTRNLAAEGGFPITLADKKDLNKEDLDKAKNNLYKYIDVIGITEEYNKSLLILQKFLGIEDIFYVRNNTTKQSEKTLFSKMELEVIAEYNQLDIQLYKFARELMLERFEKENLADELIEYQKKLEEYQNNFEWQIDKKVSQINKLINNIDKSSKIALYSSGEHTKKLFQLTDIKEINFECILDTYKNDEQFEKFKVCKATSETVADVDVIVVSNFMFQNKIVEYLKDTLGFDGKIITFYTEKDAVPFYES